MKGVLWGGCYQKQGGFDCFLKARSKEAFSRMTAQARVALMKRFVLLNEPGKATASANPAGRPIVRCQTPDVTTEMQIVGAALRDNVAFLPMALRDATDTPGAEAHQITLGLLREGAAWQLLSLASLVLRRSQWRSARG